MEESVKVLLLQQEKRLLIREIFNLKPLNSEEQVKEIRLPFQLKRFKVGIEVLDVCIYYTISIEKNLNGGGSVQFRERCLSVISDYYISRRMSFQFYEYGYLCSRMLSLPLEKVIHILHFMIYAKLASKPYVANLIILAKQKKKNVVKDNARDQEDTIYSSAKDSRHFTVFMESNQIEIDIFRKELKKVLNSPGESKKTGKKTDNKRYFNIKNVYPDEEELFDENQNLGEEPILKTGIHNVVNIPSKVGSFDNSSVITRLKYSSSRQDVGSHSIKKLQMRRQKFNEDFDCLKKYEILENSRRESKKNDWSAGNGVEDAKKSISGAFRQQKHPYEYFSQMASTIKSKNKQLDSIRFECASRTFKRNALKETEWNRQDKACKAKIISASANENYFEQFSKEKEKEKENFMDSEQRFEEEPPRLLMKKTEKSLTEETSRLVNTVSITRKAEDIGQEQRLLEFNKKMKNKMKLQKYKEQYRQFLKTQMFERERIVF